MKAKNLALIILIAIPLLLLAVGIYVTINLNSLVTKGVQSVGSDITQTSVTLQKSDISVLSGEGTLNQLSIGNPKGFSDNKAIELDSIKVALDTESLASDTVIIKDLVIDKPAIRYEVSKTSSNLRQLLDNVKGSGAATGSGKQQTTTGKKLIINRLVISNGHVSIIAPPMDKPLSATLPTLTLKDIGRNEGGITPDKAFQLVLSELTTATSAAAAPSLDKLREQMGVKLEGETKGIVNTIKDKAGELGDKVKGLFK